MLPIKPRIGDVVHYFPREQWAIDLVDPTHLQGAVRARIVAIINDTTVRLRLNWRKTVIACRAIRNPKRGWPARSWDFVY